MKSIAFISESVAIKRWLIHKPVTKVITEESSLTASFVRNCPNDEVYIKRLEQELELIHKNNFEPIFMQVVNLLKHTGHIQHIVRGSAAGSLVSWMLGITNIDPIQHGMALERFMNHKRLNKPDIDLDFPQFLRNDVLDILYRLYPNRVARICNHVMWRPQSAFREAMRKTKGNKCSRTFQIASELVNKPHYDSLHCGGVVIFDNKVPADLVIKEKPGAKVVDYKIKYNKKEVEDNGLIKIDILSNRGLSILHALDPVRKIHEYPTKDAKIVELLSRADVLGITYCETPLVIKIIREIKPTSPVELSLCLALVRPAPNKKAVRERLFNGETNLLVYDDDVLQYIAEVLDTDLGEGEKIRKQLIKDEPGAWESFTNRLKMRLPHQTVKKIMDNLQNVAKYGFCKSHSMNYAYMCWALLWHKAHNRDNFWCSVLTHAKNQYEDWVYFWQVQKEGYSVELIKYKKGVQHWKCKNKYLYCSNTPKRQTNLLSFFKPIKSNGTSSIEVAMDQLRDYGYWNNNGGKWFKEMSIRDNTFCGLIACWRPYKTQNGVISYVTVCVDNELWNVMVEGELPKAAVILSGKIKINGEYEGISREWNVY